MRGVLIARDLCSGFLHRPFSNVFCHFLPEPIFSSGDVGLFVVAFVSLD
jgi:hypothetical protein